MPYDPRRHHRRSIRLKGYDYTAPGAYFVTICVQGRACLFGAADRGGIALNDAGVMVQAEWLALPARFPTLRLDAFVVMPDHMHGIVVILEPRAGDVHLGDAVGAFKSLSTNAYICGVRQHSWPPFGRRLWQRNYYEHVVRDEAALNRIRSYIVANPGRWAGA